MLGNESEKFSLRRVEINYPGANNYSQFAYDGFGHTVKIVETSAGIVTSTRQFVCPEGGMSEQRDGSGLLNAQYFARGAVVGGTNYFYTRTHDGSIRELMDAIGVVRGNLVYDCYGEVLSAYRSVISDFQYAGYYLHLVAV